MGARADRVYCGPLSVDLGHLLGRPVRSDPARWFGPGRVRLTHMGRVAIRQACDVLRLGSGDEVLVPAYNCGTEVDALLAAGASVVLYRVDRAARIDVDDLQARISPRTRAVYVIHYFGFPQPLDRIVALCRERGLRLIEDCALSLFSRDGAEPIGCRGHVSIFNFPKSAPVPDGGALVVNDAALEDGAPAGRRPPRGAIVRGFLPLLKRAMLRRFWGVPGMRFLSPPMLGGSPGSLAASGDAGREEMPRSYRYDRSIDGTRLSRTSERILRTLDVPRIVARRRENYATFLELLSGAPGLEPLFRDLPEGVCPLCFPVIVGRRGEACGRLEKHSVSAIRWWAGYHPALPWDAFPDACHLKDRVLALPVHQQLDASHVLHIARLMKTAVNETT